MADDAPPPLHNTQICAKLLMYRKEKKNWKKTDTKTKDSSVNIHCQHSLPAKKAEPCFSTHYSKPLGLLSVTVGLTCLQGCLVHVTLFSI